MIELIRKDPFRLFFPLGTLWLILGISVWIYPLFDEESYPIELHRYLVMNGFLMSFIGGFLFTAIPRFIGAKGPSMVGLASFFAVFVVGIVYQLLGDGSYLGVIGVCQALLILLFLLLRFTKRDQNPPYTFIFIPLGLLMFALMSLGEVIDLPVSINIYLPVSLIIIGVGGRLIPGLLGHVEIVKQQRGVYEQVLPLYKVIPLKVYALAVSFFVMPFLTEDIQNWFMALACLFWGLYFCRLHKFPKTRSFLSWGIWISSHLMMLTFLINAFYGEGGVHLVHGLFIGTFFLMTMIVAARVIRAHSGVGIEFENHKGLLIFTIFVVISMLSRLSVLFTDAGYLRHLAYGSIFGLAALAIWGFLFIPMCLKPFFEVYSSHNQ